MIGVTSQFLMVTRVSLTSIDYEFSCTFSFLYLLTLPVISSGKRAACFAAWNLLDFILKDSQFGLNTGHSDDQDFIEPDLTKIHEPPDQDSSSTKSNLTDSKVPDEENTSREKKEHTEDLVEALEKDLKLNTDTIPPVKTENVSATNQPKISSYSTSEELESVKQAIKSGFLRVDESMRTSAQDRSGSTAVCAMISPTHLFIANCGDSRAVFCSSTDKSNYEIFATEDHKPFKEKERQRIINAGGCATQRINGTLAVSRALGDFEFKRDTQRGPCEQLVSPEPEVTIIERKSDDQFLILACDGIWDVMDNQDICELVRYKLKVEPSLEKVCSSILDACLTKGSRDNMSIIIVVFENGPKFSEEEQLNDKKNDELIREIAEGISVQPSSFNEFVVDCSSALADLTDLKLPIEAKYDLLREVFQEKCSDHEVPRKVIMPNYLEEVEND